MNEVSVPRLLLIEPSDTTAAPIRALLEQNGFRVDPVSNIHEARARDLAPYGVIIVDIHRRDRDALLFVQWLHQQHSHLIGRVVVVSADSSEELAQELDSLGVCDIVPKPVDAEEILRAVLECLELTPTVQ